MWQIGKMQEKQLCAPCSNRGSRMQERVKWHLAGKGDKRFKISSKNTLEQTYSVFVKVGQALTFKWKTLRQVEGTDSLAVEFLETGEESRRTKLCKRLRIHHKMSHHKEKNRIHFLLRQKKSEAISLHERMGGTNASRKSEIT
jgi:hypothetical protein